MSEEGSPPRREADPAATEPVDLDLEALRRETDAALANLAAPFSAINSEISKRFQDMQARILAVNERFDKCGDRISEVRGGLDEVATALTVNDTKVNDVLQDVAALQKRINGVLANVDRVTDRLGDLNASARALDRRIATTKGAMEGDLAEGTAALEASEESA